MSMLMGLMALGGSERGLTLKRALIHVAAPIGSDVTFSSGGISKQIKWNTALEDVNGVVAHYFYQPSLLGTWTISASLNNFSTQDSVTINNLYQYDVQLFYRKYFIKNGVWNTNASEYTSTNFNITQNTGSLQVKNTANNTAIIRTVDKIDLVDYSKLILQLNYGPTNIYGQSWKGTQVPTLGVATGTNAPAVSGDDIVNGTNFIYLRDSTGVITTEQYELDLINVNDPGYVYVSCASSSGLSGTYGYLNIANLYLE